MNSPAGSADGRGEQHKKREKVKCPKCLKKIKVTQWAKKVGRDNLKKLVEAGEISSDSGLSSGGSRSSSDGSDGGGSPKNGKNEDDDGKNELEKEYAVTF